MMRAILQRDSDNGKCTLGTLTIGDLVLFTLEETWKNNLQGQSCVPSGEYSVVPHGWESDTKLHQRCCYQLLHTSPREGILIHSGNTTMDIEGCILVGTQVGKLAGMDAVLHSRDAMELLRATIGQNSFILQIRNPVDGASI